MSSSVDIENGSSVQTSVIDIRAAEPLLCIIQQLQNRNERGAMCAECF
jgi:hypothetical protein